MKAVKTLILLTILILTANGQQKDSSHVQDTSKSRTQLHNSDLSINTPLFLQSAFFNYLAMAYIDSHEMGNEYPKKN
jgi:hypothetical protein